MTKRPADTGPILLLGAGGQTGWELRRTLSPLGSVVALDRTGADLADAAALVRVVRALRPSLIVNAAAYNAVDKAEEEERLAHAVNGEAPGILAEEARHLGAALVHYSTDYVFGDKIQRAPDGEPRPFREDDPTSPGCAYGRSKLAGEDAIRAVGGDVIVFRTSWVYSQRGRTFLAALLRRETQGDELRVVSDQISSPTWARGLADATALILAATWANGGGAALAPAGGLLHLAGGGEASRYAFADAAFTLFGAAGHRVPRLVPVSAASFPTPAARPAYSALDSSRVRSLFGIGLPDWQTSLALCIDARGTNAIAV